MIGAAVVVTVAACGSFSAERLSDPNAVQSLPVIEELGSRAHAFGSLDELAAVSSAVVVATPTGGRSAKPLPAVHGGNAGSAPTPYVEMRVSRVVSGVVTSELIDVVSPGIDTVTGKPALLVGGPFLMYLAPAMYDVNAPAGGYAISGGPAGVYGSTGVDDEFRRIDTGSPSLPERIVDLASLPGVNHTALQLLAQGPR